MVEDRIRTVNEEKRWLAYGDRLVDSIHARRRGYDMLFEQLHETAFIFILPFDSNREGDGLYLRKRMGIRDRRQCSVLEMLVAFSDRAFKEYFAGCVDTAADVFWIMLHNLGLDGFADNVYDDVEVAEILDTWLNRRFDANGNGSIFPLRRTNRDQRDVEIWSQMNEYVNQFMY